VSTKKFGVMLAKEYSPAKITKWDDIVIEPKLDGVRVIITVDSRDRIKFFSRNGRELTMFGHLERTIIEACRLLRKSSSEFMDGTMFDGEMVGDTFGEIAGAIHRKKHTEYKARFFCFYAMPLIYFRNGSDTISQGDRYDVTMVRLRRSFYSHEFKIVNPVRVSSHNDIVAFYDNLRDDGYEGAIVKDYARPWVAMRSGAWMKMKAELTVDVRVKAMREGTGKYKGTLGALVVDHSGVDVKVSGMSDEQRHQFWGKPKKILGKMIEVSYQEETVHGSLRHPRFMRLRPDKE